MSRPTVAEINIQALENNWNVLTQIKNSKQLIPVIKANAYGHGVSAVATNLQKWGAQSCAVAMLEEAQIVRSAGFLGRILILGPIPNSDFSEIKKWDAIPVIGDKENLFGLGQSSYKGPVHIKWDTGMNRLGLKLGDEEWLYQFKKAHPEIILQAFCTHFLKSSDYESVDGFSQKQINEFKKIENQFPDIIEKHIFNTDSLFANHQTKFLPESSYGARPGLSLYGYSSYSSEWTKKLMPVMTLKTKIVHLVKVKSGETVSYNASWKASRDSVIGVLPIGYADGYPRSLSNKGQVFLHQMRVPLVGIVCMDYLMIDVTDVTQARVGDDVELWGNNISLDFLAQTSGTIVYELLTALTARVPRITINPK